MKITVIAKPRAKENRVEKIGETHYRVWVKAPPDEGRANQAICEVLADYLGIPKLRLSVAAGHKSKTKILEIE